MVMPDEEHTLRARPTLVAPKWKRGTCGNCCATTCVRAAFSNPETILRR